jgi:hypothetical protein
VLLALLVALVSCSSPRVSADFDPDYDFTGKQTYAWRAGVPAASELNERRIVKSVDEVLAAHGLRPAPGGQPDLWVSTEVSTRQELRSSGGNVSLGMGRSMGAGSLGVGVSSPTQTYEVTVGTLVIELRDGASEQVVWRTVAKDTVKDDAKDAEQTIVAAVQAAFEDYPPKR